MRNPAVTGNTKRRNVARSWVNSSLACTSSYGVPPVRLLGTVDTRPPSRQGSRGGAAVTGLTLRTPEDAGKAPVRPPRSTVVPLAVRVDHVRRAVRPQRRTVAQVSGRGRWHPMSEPRPGRGPAPPARAAVPAPARPRPAPTTA